MDDYLDRRLRHTLLIHAGAAAVAALAAIETKGPYNKLRGVGRDYGQGYFIAHATPEHVLLHWFDLRRPVEDAAERLAPRRCASMF